MEISMKNFLIKILVSMMVISIIFSGLMLTSNLKSKASKDKNSGVVNENTLIDEEKMKELADEFRSDDKEITINSIDELYNVLDSYSEVTEEVVQEVLSKSSDRVVVKYIFNEIAKFSVIEEKMYKSEKNEPDIKKQLDSYEQKQNIEVENNIQTDYYINSNASKTVTTIKDRLGSKMVIEVVDQDSNEEIKKIGWIKIGTWNEEKNKPFGQRKFSYASTLEVAGKTALEFKSIFHYYVTKESVTTTELDGEISGPVKKIFSCSVKDEIKDTTAINVKENIDGTVIYTMSISAPVIPAGIEINTKHNVVATIKKLNKDSKDMEHYVAVYGQGYPTLGSSLWDFIARLL